VRRAKGTGDKIAGVTGDGKAPATRSPAVPGVEGTGDKIAGVTDTARRGLCLLAGFAALAKKHRRQDRRRYRHVS